MKLPYPGRKVMIFWFAFFVHTDLAFPIKLSLLISLNFLTYHSDSRASEGVEEEGGM